jgi:hypothetical protein
VPLPKSLTPARVTGSASYLPYFPHFDPLLENAVPCIGLFDQVEQHFGSRPDIVLTTAGIIDEKDWQKCLDINVVSSKWNE